MLHNCEHVVGRPARVPTVFMFSGQGSQHFAMGQPLFESDPTFRRTMLELDEVVRGLCGASIIATLYSAPDRWAPFDRLALTHPAIFMVEYSMARTLIHSGVRPDVVLGASLGSFVGAVVAGALDVEATLAAVVRQASAFEAHCMAGGMIAILGDPGLYEQSLRESCELAGINFPTHFVVAAKGEQLDGIERSLRERKISYQRLPVPFPFHSRWIDCVRGPFESSLGTLEMRTAKIPLMCCDRVALLRDLPDGYFWSVVRRPIRLRDAITALERTGPYRYIDAGPAGTMATFVKYCLPRAALSTTHAIMTLAGRDLQNLAALQASTT